MKKLKLTTCILICLGIFSCNIEEQQNQQRVAYHNFYSGKHELRKFSSQERTTASTASASYFLFWGSASMTGEKKTSVIAFSWRSKNGEYILTKVPMTQVRVKFDNVTLSPYVTFSIDYPRGSESSNPDTNVEYVMEYRLNYVVVHCKESDYPTDININDIN